MTRFDLDAASWRCAAGWSCGGGGGVCRSGSERRDVVAAGLDGLLDDARTGLLSVVVVARLDRLGRSIRHLVGLLGELDDLGFGGGGVRFGDAGGGGYCGGCWGSSPSAERPVSPTD